MNAIVAGCIDAGNGLPAHSANNLRNPIGRIGALFFDPLDDIVDDDEVQVTTRRAVGRIGLVAAETSDRFQQEGVGHDPRSWIFPPCRVLDGVKVIDSCRDREFRMRSVLVHCLDVDRAAVTALLASDDEDDRFDEHEFNYPYGGGAGSSSQSVRRASDHSTRMRLFIVTAAENRENSMQAFHASVACRALEVRARRQLFSREQIGRPHVVTLNGMAAWRYVRMLILRVSWFLCFADATVRDHVFGWLGPRVHSWEDWGALACRKGWEAFNQVLVDLIRATQAPEGRA